LQEVLSHRRVIEGISEKIGALHGTPAIAETVKSISKRYEDLVDGYLRHITQLEEALQAFHAFHDLHKAYFDYQKQQWDRLAGYSGMTHYHLLQDCFL